MDQPPSQVVQLAVNLDDVTGEIIGHAIDTIMAEGALDCWATPVIMKKSRPGQCIEVLADQAQAKRLAKRLIELTGSFGVRMWRVDRVIVNRRHEAIDTAFGPIRMKIGELDGKDIVAKPEFEDVNQAAQRYGVSPRTVVAAAMTAWATLDRSES